jgi:glycosyltransferase involved in cell wall biosynthesis
VGELVLIAGRDPTRHIGGAESYMVAHALTAKLAGFEPQVFVAARRTETCEVAFGTLHRVASSMWPGLGYLSVLHRPWLSSAVVHFLRDRPGPHVIHAHVGWARSACDAAAKLSQTGVSTRALGSFYATVEHEQGAKYRSEFVREDPLKRLRYALLFAWVRAVSVREERAGYRGVDAVTFNYERVRRLLVEAYGERDAMHRIAYCTPAAFRGDAGFVERPAAGGGSRTEPPLIVTVSRHSPRKGLHILIRALAQLRDRGIDFRAQLVGGGPMLAANRRLVAELGLERRVAFMGTVPDQIPYLRECDVFVLPSTAEDSGAMAVLEALQVGAPIVASAVDGVPEDLKHERDALLVSPGSVSELCDALARMLADDELRRRLSRGARATYEARFTPELAAADLGGVYRRLGLSIE